MGRRSRKRSDGPVSEPDAVAPPRPAKPTGPVDRILAHATERPKAP